MYMGFTNIELLVVDFHPNRRPNPTRPNDAIGLLLVSKENPAAAVV
jgi:hypothetical protein